MSIVGVVGGGAGGVGTLRVGLVQPLLDDGHIVAVTLTPTAANRLRAGEEFDALQRATGLPVRFQPRLPGGKSPDPRIDLFIAAPMTADSVAELALGLADNQALAVMYEHIATTPMVVFPRSTLRMPGNQPGPATSGTGELPASTSSTATTCGSWPSLDKPAPAKCRGPRSSLQTSDTTDSALSDYGLATLGSGACPRLAVNCATP